MSKIIPIEQKAVNFQGAELMAFRANNGQVYAGVKWICQGIGLTEGQYQNQTRKINSDPVTIKGIAKMQHPTSGGNQEILCMSIDFLPLWLAKINANIIKDNEVQERLIQYQLKAKDVLAEAFLQNQPEPLSQTEVLHQITGFMVEQEKKVSALQGQISQIKDTIVNNDPNWREWVNDRLRAIGRKLGDYSEPRNESYDLLDSRGHCNLELRLLNLKNRMRLEGATRTEINQKNNLDVIEVDPRLKEIYTAIVKELAIKYL